MKSRKEQWFSSVNPSPPIWKFVFIYYCITLFTACVLFVTHFSLLRKETIRLLNSGIQVEQTVNLKGQDSVNTFYLCFIAQCIIGVCILPIIGFAFGLIRPCMPPALTSSMGQECKSWDHVGQIGIVFQTCLSILLGYIAGQLAANVVFAVGIVLVYPTVIKLIILDSIARNFNRAWQNGFAYLRTFRTLQILSIMHNAVLSQPIMPVFVGGVTVCLSFALYILIVPTSEVPLPVFLLFCQVTLHMFVIIVGPFKMMACPLVKSIEVLKSLERIKGTSLVRKFVRSCPPCKMSLGDGTFFDMATSLVILRKSVDLLIYFLLT
ncbi:hypothetical protein Fcan01_15554 [Folsomia candida]|uniref:Uncharacterized protein n=1 Tax=Folsomia candida TaxID=158441 RepID=A0A226DWK3_FOLCA|nr:hypothetical protein Fcan01_15554 [Folsomia candida]